MFNIDNLQVADSDNLNLLMGGENAASKDAKKDKEKDKEEKSASSGKKDATVDKTKSPAASKQDIKYAFTIPEKEKDKNEEENVEENVDDIPEEEEVNEEEENAGKGKKKKKDNEEEDEGNEEVGDTPQEVKDFLKSRVEFLIKKGEWVDFEGRKDVEWDEDTFAEYELEQRALQRDELAESIIDSFGPIGSILADYSRNGGDPDKLLDLFIEKTKIDTADISTEEGQRSMVYEYQTKVLGRSPERAKKAVETLIADKELEAEAKDVQKVQATALEKQKTEEIKKQKDIAIASQKQEDDKIQSFSANTKNAISARKDIPDNEKQELIKLLTVFSTDGNGKKVNGFAKKFVEFRKDLNKYIEMVRLVNNPKRYLKAAGTDKANQVAEKDFKLLRTAGASKPSKAAETTKKGSAGTRFRVM